MTEEDEAFERIEHAQGWRKRQVADKVVLTRELDPYRARVRNETIEEVARAVEKFSGAFGPDTVSSFAIYIREMKHIDRIEVMGVPVGVGGYLTTTTTPQPQQAEKQEPVAVYQYRNPHCSDWYDGIPDHHDGHGPYEVRTLYTTPQPQQEPVKMVAYNCLCGRIMKFESVNGIVAPQREWVGLTDAELAEFSDMKLGSYDLCLEVEAKLRSKNT